MRSILGDATRRAPCGHPYRPRPPQRALSWRMTLHRVENRGTFVPNVAMTKNPIRRGPAHFPGLVAMRGYPAQRIRGLCDVGNPAHAAGAKERAVKRLPLVRGDGEHE